MAVVLTQANPIPSYPVLHPASKCGEKGKVGGTIAISHGRSTNDILISTLQRR